MLHIPLLGCYWICWQSKKSFFQWTRIKIDFLYPPYHTFLGMHWGTQVLCFRYNFAKKTEAWCLWVGLSCARQCSSFFFLQLSISLRTKIQFFRKKYCKGNRCFEGTHWVYSPSMSCWPLSPRQEVMGNLVVVRARWEGGFFLRVHLLWCKLSILCRVLSVLAVSLGEKVDGYLPNGLQTAKSLSNNLKKFWTMYYAGKHFR